MRWVRMLLGVLLAAGCTGAVPVTAVCATPETEEGLIAFREQTGVRAGPRDLRLRFVLNTTLNERYTATPDITTNLGQVLDAQASVGVLDVQLLLPTDVPVDGVIRLSGSISANFDQQRDRCPYVRSFRVSEQDQAITVTGP